MGVRESGVLTAFWEKGSVSVPYDFKNLSINFLF